LLSFIITASKPHFMTCYSNNFTCCCLVLLRVRFPCCFYQSVPPTNILPCPGRACHWCEMQNHVWRTVRAGRSFRIWNGFWYRRNRRFHVPILSCILLKYV